MRKLLIVQQYSLFCVCLASVRASALITFNSVQISIRGCRRSQCQFYRHLYVALATLKAIKLLLETDKFRFCFH